MSAVRVRVLFVLAVLAAIVVGPIIPANAAVPAIDVTGIVLNECADYATVWFDPESLTVYGDQNGDLRLSGDDCNWK